MIGHSLARAVGFAAAFSIAIFGQPASAIVDNGDGQEVLEIQIDGSVNANGFANVVTKHSTRSSTASGFLPFEQDFATFKQRSASAIVPPGRIVELPKDVLPRTVTLCPSRSTVIVTDMKPHGNLNGGRTFSWLYKAKPYPWAYMLHPGGDLVRKMEFADRRVLPYGLAESRDGRVAITFYSAVSDGEARVEVWDTSLDTKLTYHDYSLRAAIPAFDADGLLWVPYTILDRLNEEHPTIIALWVYKRDGSRWEVFPRRQMVNVRFPHSVHIDNAGRIYVAGLVGKWPYVDDTYGLGPRPGLDLTKANARIDVYTLVKDPSAPEYVTEQIERWKEMNGGWDKAPEPPGPHAYADIRPAAVLKLHRSFAFPFFCVQTLFALTGDGHALAACHGESTLAVLRLGRPGRDFSSSLPSSSGQGKGSGEGILREAWAPSIPISSLPQDMREGLGAEDPLTQETEVTFGSSSSDGQRQYEEVVIDLEETDGPDASLEARVVAKLHRPFGVGSIGGIQMDPSGSAFVLLDTAGRRVVSSPWPLLQEASGDSEPGQPRNYTLPRANTKHVKVGW